MEIVLFFGFILGAIILIVGAILFFIDYAQKRSKKKSLIIVGVGVTLAIISLGGISLVEQHNARLEEIRQEKLANQKKRANKKFISTASEYLAEYYILFGKSETLGNSINKDWGNAIDDSTDDFDVDKTIETIENKNTDTISEITDGQSKLDDYLATLEKNDTGTYDLKIYKTANSRMTDLTNKVTSISGSYSSFASDFSDADDAVSKSFSAISKSF